MSPRTRAELEAIEHADQDDEEGKPRPEISVQDAFSDSLDNTYGSKGVELIQLTKGVELI